MVKTSRIACAVLLLCIHAGQAIGARVIEDFDDGEVVLVSFPGEDVHPDSWRLDTLVTYDSSPFSLRLHGNTWKVEPIGPVALNPGDVWQVAAFVGSTGEIQGFGLADSADTLLYAFAGTELVNPAQWVPVYQGAFPTGTWNLYQLPVAEDWLARFGRLPTVTDLVYVNDRDTDPRAIVYFDDIRDITDDLPVAPRCSAWYEAGGVFANALGRKSVTVQFHSRVVDPDSRGHDFLWFFGDDSTGRDSNPAHTYVVEDDHEYTVLLEVTDSTGRRGRATCQVVVDSGPTSFPVRLNFVGDIMLARRYETPGGIIDTMGPEGVFDSIRPWLGDADITVANLESPLCSLGTRHATKPIVFRGRPGNVAGLVHAGIDIVSLANNHVIDYGLAGLQQMQQRLAANGVLFSGAGADAYEAGLPLFCQQSGLAVAFLASCDRNGQYDNYQPFLDAGYNKPGFAYLDSFHVRRQIETVRDLADLVVVEFHTGEEYELTPMASGNDEFLIPNDEWGDEFYSPLALYPAPGDTEERHRAIEAGADLVVCHHPHLLQPFEVYRGRLIAHSLGDFTFDLDYPECYPSVILNASADATGFYDYTVTPVYIDDYIPRRARGELGLRLLDDIARRSRDLNAYLVVDRESVFARIVLDTTRLVRYVYARSEPLRLARDSGYSVSEPLLLASRGNVSKLLSVTPPDNWEYRLGRDRVWFGNMEDDGATMWLLDNSDEGYDTVGARGRRSLRQVRQAGAGTIATGLEERLVVYSESAYYTLHASIRTANAANAGVEVRYFSARTGSTPLGSSDLGTTVSGTTDWTCYHQEFRPANLTAFFDVRMSSDGPSSDTGMAWFDDVGIIEWDAWQPLSGPVPVVQPNDYYRVQLRTRASVTDAVLNYEETSCDPPVGISTPPDRRAVVRRFRGFPNPAAGAVTLAYDLTRPTAVSLRVYDVLGREVRTLLDRSEGPGRRQVRWDGRDNQGRLVGAGAYFCQLEAGGSTRSTKLVLTR